MHSDMKHMLADHEKGTTERMAERYQKHAVELNELEQSQMATYDLSAKIELH
jgi:hypothetical protein